MPGDPDAPDHAPAGPALPSREALRRFLREAPGRVGKSEIARHFGLGVEQRPALRSLMKALEEEGWVPEAGARPHRGGGTLPEMAALEVFGTDADGEPMARPIRWEGHGRPPLVLMRPERPGQPALAPGERILARVRPLGGGRYEGRTFKRIGGGPARILGVYQEGRIQPTDRRQRSEWSVSPENSGGAEPGELVLAEAMPGGPLGLRPARVVERLGPMDAPRAVSMLCIHAHRIPEHFPPEALAEAERARPIGPEGREDLRALPLVTIDGEDARDFDDAVWAAAEDGGWRVVVAIADVAHYVRPGSALDRAARERGNSVYFPDRVVPMLPEALSNGLCSLRPEEERACLFVEMRFDARGGKTGHRFGRGLMRSSARLTYEQVEAARVALDATLPMAGIEALYGAYAALAAARGRRGTLDLDLPERRVLLAEDGAVRGVVPRQRLDSHRLIEEFMVAANVCAAEELERRRQPLLYRVHERPSDEKLEALRQFLGAMELELPPSDQIHPRHFAGLLEQVADRPEARLVHEMVLRAQSQAAYAPENAGHFGLALARYAHFTSPIRRYADLVVHRALVSGLRLGADGLEEAEAAALEDTAEHITRTERRAAAAEREAVERYLALHMASRVGGMFAARISGVTRFGLFVTLEENGAGGLVPSSSLPDDQWTHEEAAHRLTGRHTRLCFSLGQAVEVRLAEAMPLTGGLLFQLLGGAAPAPGARRGRIRRGPPGGGRPAPARGARPR
ncbi:ribonuclease R [Pseudoroseomonas rhizosphaerae]|uniref:Ribonuclease R n=1 Tax=Teichococcus rhizosphaerae TaxID=1335062 RepID=A0A2C7AGW5_9PROT|nr:ribonuclease R [Pseudoroseomonas rhizosphaerae]PHK96953.1 ribonuclease R [Pseudoroseomonas rhizosphaerae]